MKRLTVILAFVLLGNLTFGQFPPGKIVVEKLYSASLENSGGENPTRSVTVYLPPGYEKNIEVRYPVIYFLHGFTQSDSYMIHKRPKLDKLLDKAIATGKIRPVIVVIPDHHTLYRGSFYTNSTLTGNWADFTARDLVSYVDQKYRTITDRESRGISGHSMGGHGAIKFGMLFPDVFSSVYALSPYVLALDKDYGPEGMAYKQAQMIHSRDTLITGYKFGNANAVVAAGRAFSPNPNNPPFYADLPYTYDGDNLVVHEKVMDLWNKNLPSEMVKDYVSSLKSLTAIKLDWGWDDFFTHIPPTCRSFSEQLKELGLNHFAEEYNGSHMDKVYTENGRVLNDMLPFFDTYLKFEE